MAERDVNDESDQGTFNENSNTIFEPVCSILESSGEENIFQNAFLTPIDENSNTNNVGKPRKRMWRPEEHKKQIRKIKRQRGEEYISSTGKVVPSRTCSMVSCGCKLQCSKNIPDERKLEIFKGFHKLNWADKNSFICNLIEVKDITRRYSKADISRREKTRVYRLLDVNGKAVNVCKKFFRETFNLSDGTITNMLKRTQEFGGSRPSLSGKHEPANKTKPVDEKFVCDFIAKFPSSESCCQQNTHCRYLDPTLTKLKMYHLYKVECEGKNRKPLSEFKFRDIFNKKFSHLAFQPSHKDMCGVCIWEKTRNTSSIQNIEKSKEVVNSSDV